jgi:D-alanyl-D-alanine carboxypeptidase (penicillin-binding protein 5/6)
LPLGLAAMAASLLVLTAGPATAARVPSGRLAPPSQPYTVEFGLGAPVIEASTAFVVDADTGVVLYSNHPDVERAMASCTKIMTALVAVQHGALSQTVTIRADAAALVNPDNSYMGVSQGEKLTLDDLLYGLLLPSGNDAAVAIADAIGGNQAQFVAMMNQEAAALGLTHTHFADPHGLDAPRHYTTARDLTELAVVALHNPTIAKISATLHHAIPPSATHKGFFLTNYNSLLPGARTPYPGAIGFKPGNTGDAGWCEAFAARRDGHLVIGVVLNDTTWTQRNIDMHALLDWGFAQLNVPPAG